MYSLSLIHGGLCEFTVSMTVIGVGTTSGTIIGVETVGAEGARAPPNFLECHATLRRL